MPRLPAKNANEIYNALREFNFINEDGCYFPYCDNIWNKAFTALNNEMQKCYIYQYITQNRQNVSSRIHNFDCAAIRKKCIKFKTTKDANDYNWSMDQDDKGLKPIRATIHINMKEWQKLQLNTKLYSDDREYEILEPGWTGQIYDIVLQNYKLPCPFSFKNAKINNIMNQCFLKIKGKCPECHNKIHICSYDGPNTNGIDFHISTLDTTLIMHKKKRHLRGALRDEILKEVRAKSTRKWRLEQANKQMHFGDFEPPNLYSSIVLRKAKQQKIDEELGTGPTSNTILEVIKLKSSPEFAGSIREVCYNRFYAMYWTPEQIALYKKLIKECAGVICIDATGSIIKSLPTIDYSTSVVFLYQAVGVFNNKTLPIFQMVSEKHDANTLQYWIGEWLRAKLSPPKQVVTDFSLALLNACSVAFNQCSLKKYLQICFEKALHMNESDFLTILRIDIAHLIHFISRWPIFNKNFPYIKDFFLKCIAILSQTSSLNEFSELSTAILIVAKHKFGDIETEDDKYNTARKLLLNIIKSGYKEIYPSDDIFANLTDYNDDEQINMPENIAEFISNIEHQSCYQDNGNFPNPYYCPDFSKRFIRLCPYFLLFTNIMPFTFYKTNTKILEEMKVASSARCEAYFKDLKKLILEDMKNVRVDKFLIIHLRSLEGTTKLLCAWNKQKVRQEKQQVPAIEFDPKFSSTFNPVSTDNASSLAMSKENFLSLLHLTPHSQPSSLNNNSTPLQSIENLNSFLNKKDSWKGLLKDNKKRGYHFQPCPDVENKAKRPRQKTNMALLVNGNNFPPLEINKQFFKVNNTCAFDAFMHCIRGGYVEWTSYSNHINTSNHRIFEFVKLLVSKGVGKNIYKLRCELLLNFIKPKNDILNCECNIASLIQSIMLNEPSVTENTNCKICSKNKSEIREILCPDLAPLHKNGIAGLQESIENMAQNVTKICSFCHGAQQVTREGGAHLILDIEALQWSLLAMRSNFTMSYRKTFSLHELPTEIKFCGGTYKLSAVIAHIPGHYIPYIRWLSGKWECHDGLTTKSKPKAVSCSKQFNIHILFYVKI